MHEVENNRELVELVGPQLRELTGGRAIIWDIRRSFSAVVIRIKLPDWTTGRAMLDCIQCQRVSFAPAWEPTAIDVELTNSEPNSPLRVCDSENLSIVCDSVRLSIIDDDHRDDWFRGPPSGVTNGIDLLDRITDAKNNPARDSFAALMIYLDGYQQALQDHRLTWMPHGPSFGAFQEWIVKKLGMQNTTAGWRGAITHKYPDDKVAYRKFYSLLGRFRKEYAKGKVSDPPPPRN